jgi:hypothetical protein
LIHNASHRDGLPPAGRTFTFYMPTTLRGGAAEIDVRARMSRAEDQKMFKFKIPEQTKPFVWGAVAGAVALAVIGFGYGGWVTGGSSRQMASSASNQAVIAALAPICVSQFNAQDDAARKVTELLAISTWSRGDAVEKSGFAAIPGNEARKGDIARACADILGRT